ncbi:Protein CBG12913 [Caenorhabditis briggsae]|uniref:DNA replication complex GINS protein SLD5 n=2 Tax=Caenorhabditis briggsae TaxID=6238 RepID=A0AAE9F9Q4_CAEBR|nr:Protein CBG12913 [Caenorhabditis briggsae]ULT92548.1 hypothetical protein L3Y34_009967 [Caenorhabditis briggsae]UMM38300.1 hypothetical protein L5515_009769 [Caenorhabditis briggsae]CAP31809.1 Protein CBG12913 [Caenorhabditis briggsae]
MNIDDSAADDVDFEESITLEEVIRKMTMMWQNELCAPCLLPTQMGLVDILLDQIKGMEDNIGRQADKMQLRISLHRMELQRISFMTSDYMRCRLQKIESNPNDAIDQHQRRTQENQSELLSETELQFAREYANAEAELFEKTVLEFMPAALKKVSVPRPDHQDDMVYAKVLGEDIGNVAIPDWQDLNAEMVLEMEKSSCHLIPFQSVKHYVEEGTVQLL